MHRLDKESTIYNFTLIRKVRHRPLPLLLYGLLPVPWIVYLAVSTSFRGLLWVAGGILGMPLLYSLLTSLYLKLLGSEQRGTWSYGWKLPWIGLLPDQHVPLGGFTLIQHQLLWIGLAIIGCLYPWIDNVQWITLLSLHIWLLLPRFWIVHLLRRTKKPGLLKINPADTSYYVQ